MVSFGPLKLTFTWLDSVPMWAICPYYDLRGGINAGVWEDSRWSWPLLAFSGTRPTLYMYIVLRNP